MLATNIVLEKSDSKITEDVNEKESKVHRELLAKPK
jgi:hypothetical protein